MILTNRVSFKSVDYIVAGQVTLIVSLLICFILLPKYFFSFDQGGVSNYGINDKTIVLFVTGFSAAALGTLMAALTLPLYTIKRRALRNALFGLSLLYGLLLLTTFSYKQSPQNEQIHVFSALCLAVYIFVLVVWIRFWLPRDASIRRAFMVYCLGFAIGLLTLFDIVHLLFASQILCGTSFGYMLIHSANILTQYPDKIK